VFPVGRLVDQRHHGLAPAAEQEGADWHALGVFPFRSNDRALRGRGGETRIRMGGFAPAAFGPGAAQPVDQELRMLVVVFPPDLAVRSDRGVGENRVAAVDGAHGIGVGVHRGARSHTEEAVLGIDGVELAVRTEFHPGDIIADGLDLPARDGGLHHGQVGLAAGARESCSDVFDHAGGAGQLQNQHVLSQPALFPGLYRGDAQREAFFAQQGIAAVSGAEGDNLAGFREMGDVLLVHRGAGPGQVRLPVGQGRADRMHTFDEFGALVDLVEDFQSDPGHDAHVDYNIRAVSNLDAVFGDR